MWKVTNCTASLEVLYDLLQICFSCQSQNFCMNVEHHECPDVPNICFCWFLIIEDSDKSVPKMTFYSLVPSASVSRIWKRRLLEVATTGNER